MHSWNTFDARTNHKHTQIHKTHHNLDLGEATIFPLILCFMISHKVASKCHFSQDSQVMSLEIPKIGILATLEPHNFLCKPSIEVRFKEKL
jgi:hypothetical protein